MDITDLKAIRSTLGLSQSEFAALVGFSVRTIQSCEQGWRKPSPALVNMALLLYAAHRHGAALGDFSCWKFCGCPPERRDRCVAYLSRQGHLCWFLTGTLCQGKRVRDWRQKRAICGECRFFEHLMALPPKREA